MEEESENTSSSTSSSEDSSTSSSATSSVPNRKRMNLESMKNAINEPEATAEKVVVKESEPVSPENDEEAENARHRRELIEAGIRRHGAKACANKILNCNSVEAGEAAVRSDWNRRRLTVPLPEVLNECLQASNFQAAGVALQRSANIYGIEVDSLHAETMKMAHDLRMAFAAMEESDDDEAVIPNYNYRDIIGGIREQGAASTQSDEMTADSSSSSSGNVDNNSDVLPTGSHEMSANLPGEGHSMENVPAESREPEAGGSVGHAVGVSDAAVQQGNDRTADGSKL